MKKFKKTDVWISIVLICAGIVTGFAAKGLGFLAGYLWVGAWQITSMLVHTFNKWFSNSRTRRIYHVIVLLVITAYFLGRVFGVLLMPVLYFLLFVAPFMAIFYTWLCYREVYIKMQRPLAILK